MEGDAPRPGNDDKAWNDPPLFSYAATASAPPVANKLNKRVGFPTSSSANAASSAGDPGIRTQLYDAGAKPAASNLPPPPLSTVPVKASSDAKTECSEPDQKEPLPLEDVVAKLNSVLTKLSLDERRSQDIRKRITMMESKWKEGGLNDPITRGMSNLAEALESSDVAGAEKVQVKLTVDWPAVNAWMVGIKHIIKAMEEGDQSKNANVSQDSEAAET